MHKLLPLLLLFTLFACNTGAKRYNFPVVVDTRTKPIKTQEKKNYAFSETGLAFDNLFAGARLNGVRKLEANVYEVSIEAENEPINPSPWYAFRVQADMAQEVVVRMRYPEDVRHRYFPKLSRDRKNWMPLDSSAVVIHPDKTGADITFYLAAGDTVFLAGQEVINSFDVEDWQKSLAMQYTDVVYPFVAGQSQLGRKLPAFAICNGSLDSRPTIVLLSRQHPPEVTGFLCLQAFIDRILEHPRRDEFLGKYQVLVYPLLNPDGVDMGHWRHGAGGVDGNRDWAKYRQPEARQIAGSVVSLMKKNESRVVLGMDFHSTYRDVYYTLKDEVQPPTALPGFKDAWLKAIEDGIGGDFLINEDPGMIGKPTTMSWFRTQFGAEGITYEIGDGTDRNFVKQKGQVSANALISVLLE